MKTADAHETETRGSGEGATALPSAERLTIAAYKAANHRVVQHEGKLYRTTLGESGNPLPLKRKPPSSRDQAIRQERREGATLAEIGKRYGLTKQRVSQICK